MDIYVYTDESGVFDKEHEEFYVFGGVIFLDVQQKEEVGRKYVGAEKALRKAHRKYRQGELKACKLENKHKAGLFRSLKNEIKFSIVIQQKRVLDRIYCHKKDKQRYLDYAYKIGLKRVFEQLILDNLIIPSDIENLFIFNDEHSTATNGRYELREALEAEFKYGTYNQEWNKHFPPIFDKLRSVNLFYCNSAKKSHIRMADIIANRAYYLVKSSANKELEQSMIVRYLP